MMPNTPAQVGEGMTGVCANEKVSAEELTQICEITDSFGRTEVVPERLMDAVSAVSGCSPAYVFYVHRSNGRCCGSPGNAKKTGLSDLLHRLYLEAQKWYWKQACIREN
mgnify:CR=1 FL=1